MIIFVLQVFIYCISIYNRSLSDLYDKDRLCKMSTNQKLSRTHNAYTRLTFMMGKNNSHNIQCYVTGASSELHKILFYLFIGWLKCHL